MLALYRSGRQADALDAYRSGRKLLADELGLEPGGELRQLEKAILEHDPALASPAPPRRREPTPEQRRGRGVARSRWAIVTGAILLVGSIAGIVIAVGDGSKPVVVGPNSVAVVNTKTGRVVADIPIGGRPVAIAVGAGGVWVANADDQTIVRIDPKTKKVVKTIGGLGTDVSDIAVGFGAVWVAGGNDGTLTRIDPKVNAPGAPIDLGAGGELVRQPVFLVATGAGNVWVTRGNNVLRIDPGESEVTKTIAAGRPQGLGVGAGSVWVTQLNEHLLRVDARSGKLTADRDLSSQLFFPLVQDGSVWLVVYANKTTQVLRLDPSTLVQQGTAIPFTVERFPFDLASGAGALWTVTPADGAVWRIDPKTDRAEEVVVLGHHPIALAAGDGAVWVAVQEEPL
jgi:streptogramin lyase